MIELGKKYRDTISGIEGVATARTEFWLDKPSVRISRTDDIDGKEFWFSEGRLELVVERSRAFQT